jgi:membrane-associated protease RseP (regulator of RpoE activity)
VNSLPAWTRNGIALSDKERAPLIPTRVTWPLGHVHPDLGTAARRAGGVLHPWRRDHPRRLRLRGADEHLRVAHLIRHGRIRRAYLGIGGQQVTLQRRRVRQLELTSEKALMIVHVEAKSPAAQAKLREGDIIVGFEDEPISGVDSLHRALSDGKIGEECTLTLLRRGERIDVLIRPIESTPD